MKRRHTYRNFLILSLAATMALTSCVSGKKALIEESEPVIEQITVTPTVEEADDYTIPIATVEEADEYVWSSILAMQSSKKAKEEAEAAVTEMPFEEPVEEVEIIEEPTEGSDVEIEEVEILLPDVEILDPVEETAPEMIRAGVLGEDSAVTVKAESETASVTPETESEGRILQTDLTDGVSWLDTEEETAEADAAPINVSVYEYKEEETVDDSIKPEDILAMSDAYKGNREDQKKVTAMDKTEIITVVVTWLTNNYRYILLGLIVIAVIVLVKVLAKNLKKGTRKKKEKVEGPEFSGDPLQMIDPMENLSSVMEPPEEKEEQDSKEEELRKYITQEPDGTVVLHGNENFGFDDAIRLGAMGIDISFSENAS